MKKIYIANAFSLNMIPFSTQICVKKLTLDDAKKFLASVSAESVECVIGHQSTAKLFSTLFNVKLDCQRKPITLRPQDTLFVIQLATRLPEGKILNYDEIVEMYRQGKVHFYLVAFGPC